MKIDKKRLEILDSLRGLAALAVCFGHLSRALPDGFLKSAFFHGNKGVDVFFVISGFVIPLSLNRSGGKWREIPLFLWKRFIRLYPAYFMAILIFVLLWFLSGLFPGFRGQSVQVGVKSIFANLLFLCDIVGVPWLILVSWSLAIEWQYYLAVAFCFPFLSNRIHWIRLLTVCIWISLVSLPLGKPWLPAYGGIFALGFLSYLRWRNEIPTWIFLILSCLAASCHGAGFGVAHGAAALFSALAVLLPWNGYQWTRFLGKISYSLYLTHILVGARIINLSLRFHEGWIVRGAFFIAALAVSTLFAWCFYKMIENPSHLASQRFGKATR